MLPALRRPIAILAAVLLVVALPAGVRAEDPSKPAEAARSTPEALAALIEARRFDDALPIAWRQLEAAKRSKGSGSVEAATASLTLSEVLFELDRNAEAASHAERAVTILRRARGSASPEVAMALLAHGDALEAIDQPKAAEKAYLRALAILEARYGSAHAAVARAHFSLATHYADQKKPDEARRHYERALDIRERVLGPEHRDVAKTLARLSELHRAGGREDQATAMLERAVAIAEKAQPPAHPDLAEILELGGKERMRMRRMGEAEALFKRALAIRETSTPNGTDTIKALANLASLYIATAQYEPLDPVIERIVKVAEASTRPDASNLAALALSASARLKIASNRYVEAKASLVQSLKLTEASRGLDSVEVADILDQLADVDHVLADYASAEQQARRALAIREKRLGPEHRDTAGSLDTLAGVLETLNRWDEARGLRERSFAIREKVLGSDHPDILRERAKRLAGDGQFKEAEALYRQRLSVLETTLPAGDVRIGFALQDLAQTHMVQGRYAIAAPLLERYLAIVEKAWGPEAAALSEPLTNLATLRLLQGRSKDALALFERNLQVLEKEFGPRNPKVADALLLLASAQSKVDNKIEGERLARRALDIQENTSGPDSVASANALVFLADFLSANQRFREAEPLLQRALDVYETAPGLAMRTIEATTLNTLATVYEELGQSEDVERMRRRVIAQWEKLLGPEHQLLASPLLDLADFYRKAGRLDEAEPLLARAAAILEKGDNVAPADVANVLCGRARLRLSQGRRVEAEADLQRCIEIYESVYWPGYATEAMGELGKLRFEAGEWQEAAAYWRRSTAAMQSALERSGSLAKSSGPSRLVINSNLTGQFAQLVRALYRVSKLHADNAAALAGEALVAAQWVRRSDTAATLAQMAARTATGGGSLASLVRERQDLVVEWQQRDAMRLAAVSRPTASRNRAAELENVSQIGAVERRMAEIDKQLATEFFDYAAISNPKEIGIEEIQASLRDDEALVAFLDTEALAPVPEETFVWVVTKTGMRWAQSNRGSSALRHDVAALRCGLDRAAWDGDGASKCSELLGLPLDSASDPNRPLPFSVTRAHDLYAALFNEVRDLIAGKHLLIVPSGPLQQLPFQVLVSQQPGSDDLRGAHWLVRDHAITVLPSVASLEVLRHTAKPSAAPEPFIGFANPLLDGPQSDARFGAYFKALAATARGIDSCAPSSANQVAMLRGVRRAVTPVPSVAGHASLSHIRVQDPLPETAGEVCTVAQALGASADAIRLGERATEHEIKALSASGALARYRIVHFATHGALAGEINDTREPGLILTPPPEASDEDDGYLSASEIAALKLDADWVILSACNTAGGDGKGEAGAEALSGLARTFFYAGARALLVSHWAVNSQATVKLITSAVSALARDPHVGRAEALRQAMLAMIDHGEAREADPANWAPFVVVGEGSAAP